MHTLAILLNIDLGNPPLQFARVAAHEKHVHLSYLGIV